MGAIGVRNLVPLGGPTSFAGLALWLVLGVATSAHAQSLPEQPLSADLDRLQAELDAVDRQIQRLVQQTAGEPGGFGHSAAVDSTLYQTEDPSPIATASGETFGQYGDDYYYLPVPSFGMENGRSEYSPRLVSRFDDGFVVSTEDDEFELRIRMLEQTDFKLFLPRDQEPARSGAYIPRFRAYFEGHVTRSFEYELSLQRSVEGEFDVLDANINFRPTESFQVKVGRFLVPYSYDWYDHLEQFFITPERALFPLNFGLSREAGVMAWGEPNEGSLQYALGLFSGQQSGLADTNTTRDAVAYLNVRPFRDTGYTLLENLNIGGSGALGDQAFAEEPLPIRTSIQSSENDEAAQAASSVILEYEDDVVLLGSRRQAALHAAWYVCQLSLETEVQYGEFRYRTPTGDPILPVYGYYVSAGYFLTGEEVSGRSLVKPLRPFNPASGQFGPGAIEAFCRFSHLSLGQEVFSEGLADAADWTRRASMIDLGWNWHPNRYVKFSFDWQVTLPDTPVLIVPDTGEHADQLHLFWARAQVFL